MEDVIMMIFISFIAGYLSTMNLWAVNLNHVRWHINDLYMVSSMVLWMLLLSYIVMWDNNIIIMMVTTIVLILIIYGIRTQMLVDDKQYLNGMIPHHSMAILMSEKIKERTKDPRIKELANNIIKSQTNEIDMMTKILSDTNSNNYVF
jgi:hypothetical protein